MHAICKWCIPVRIYWIRLELFVNDLMHNEDGIVRLKVNELSDFLVRV